jgi:response regulator RpfG family c-di-GMP phosphodiesterase
MKLIRKGEQQPATNTTSGFDLSGTQPRPPRHVWKVLVVDDEPDVRTMTRLCLKDFRFASRELQFLEAASAAEARALLAEHSDIAVALVDVVMETDDAGLQLVNYIRNELGNSLIRLIIRTGQPGMAPERAVIDNFDIDDYKDKSELTATRLYTSVRSAIKAYRDLRAIELNRAGLARLLAAAPEIYRLGANSVSEFFNAILTQVIGLCHLSDSSFISTIDGLVATVDGADIQVHAVTGSLDRSPRFLEIQRQCVDFVLNAVPPAKQREGAVVLPLTNEGKVIGCIYLEPTSGLPEADMHLIRLLAQQCSSALENVKLHIDLKQSFDHAIDMLAEVAEFKDKGTGDHVSRIGEYTTLLATAMGIPEAEAASYGAASRLHDVGKVGVADNILRKPGPLSATEREAMRAHTEIGAVVLSHDESFALAREISLGHHERWDGGGYPMGRPSRVLHLATRIVSVVDVFDALISERPYKDAWDSDRAARAIANGAGTQFDPEVVVAFLKLYQRGAFAALIDRSQTEAQCTEALCLGHPV